MDSGFKLGIKDSGAGEAHGSMWDLDFGMGVTGSLHLWSSEGVDLEEVVDWLLAMVDMGFMYEEMDK